MLGVSDVVYEAQTLSYFREHCGTVRVAMARSGRVIEENLDVLGAFSSGLAISPSTWRAALRAQVDRWIVLALRYRIPVEANARIYRRAAKLRTRFGWFLLWRVLVTVSTTVPRIAGKGIWTRLRTAAHRPPSPPDVRAEAK